MDQIPSSPPIPAQAQPIPVAPNKKSTLKKTIFLIFLLFIIITIVSAAVYLTFNLYKPKNSIPGSGSVFINPSEEFQAEIEKIEGNSLLVSYLKTDPASPENPQEFVFKVIINEQTTITSEQDITPSQNSATPAADTKPAYSISYLSPGQSITVITAGDLRTITSNTITAKSIIISPGLTIFIGKIEEIKSNELIVKSGPPSVAEEKTYTIVITKDTEIVNSKIMNNSSDEASQKLTIKDLSPGSTILVKTLNDINKVTKTQASKIELIRAF